MEKKIYIAPKFKVHKFEVRCLDTISQVDQGDDREAGSKSTSTSMWESMDD